MSAVFRAAARARSWLDSPNAAMLGVDSPWQLVERMWGPERTVAQHGLQRTARVTQVHRPQYRQDPAQQGRFPTELAGKGFRSGHIPWAILIFT